MVGSIHEHKGKQELFLAANTDESKTLLEVALIQSTGASNRIEGIYTTDKRLKELVRQKAEPRNRSEQEISGYREVLSTIHESYEYINPRPNIILQLHRDLYSYSGGNAGGNYKNSDNVIAETDAEGHQKYFTFKENYIPVMFIFAAFFQETGLMWAQPVADVLSLILAIVLYKRKSEQILNRM